MKRGLLLNLVVLLVVCLPLSCLALPGRVSYPNGSPADDAVVIFSAGVNQEPVTVACGATGRFELVQTSVENAVIKFEAPDGKPFVGPTCRRQWFDRGSAAAQLDFI